MPSFLSAHGFDPGPTQRPVLAGLLSGALATIPATAMLLLFGAVEVEAEILGLSMAATLAAGCAVMAASGALYGRLFGRGANDRRGGWLFGMAYGFLLWMGGAVMTLPLVGGGEAPAGGVAVGIFLSLVTWGTAMGALFPHVHRPLHTDVSAAEMPSTRLGSGAAGDPRSARRGL